MAKNESTLDQLLDAVNEVAVQDDNFVNTSNVAAATKVGFSGPGIPDEERQEKADVPGPAVDTHHSQLIALAQAKRYALEAGSYEAQMRDAAIERERINKETFAAAAEAVTHVTRESSVAATTGAADVARPLPEGAPSAPAKSDNAAKVEREG